MKAVNDRYEPEKCPCCKQSITYLMPIDRGTVDIVKAISVAIGRKRQNVIHPRKEMEVDHKGFNYQYMVTEGKLTSNQVGNLSRARFHGLIAKVRGESGNYCLTRKGAAFLRGEEIPRYAIISKAEGHQIGYWKPEIYTVKVKEFRPDEEYWEGIGYDIVDGRVVNLDAVQQALL